MKIIYNFNFLKILNIVLPADVVKLVLKNVYLYLKLEVSLINNFEQKKKCRPMHVIFRCKNFYFLDFLPFVCNDDTND